MRPDDGPIRNEADRCMLRLVLQTVVAVLVLLSVSMIATPRTAYACICDQDRPFSEESADVDFAFLGEYVQSFSVTNSSWDRKAVEVEEVRSFTVTDSRSEVTVFKINQVYKGQVGPYFIVKHPPACMSVTPHPDYDLGDRLPAELYAFIASGSVTFPTLGFCESTVRIKVLTDLLGPSYPPDIAVLEQQLAYLSDTDRAGIPRGTLVLLRQLAASDPAVSPHISADLLEDPDITAFEAWIEDTGMTVVDFMIYSLYVGAALAVGVVAAFRVSRRTRRKTASIEKR